LIQIFAPGTTAIGAARYYELIFEREASETAGTEAESTDRDRVTV
jgi:hypothetical protein